MDWFIHAVFIVPASQIHVLDLAYQLYVYELFHQNKLNRLSHLVGIPISLMATYVLLSPLPWASEAALVIVAGLQLMLFARATLRSLLPAVLIFHVALWLFAMGVMSHVFVFSGPLWLHPATHVLFWPALQYATHALESNIPPPVSGGTQWVQTRDLLLGRSNQNRAVLLALAPFQVFVELISSHRNSFLWVLLPAERLGYRPKNLAKVRRFIAAECRKPAPVLEYKAFRASLDRTPESIIP